MKIPSVLTYSEDVCEAPILDRNNPHSVINLSPPPLADAITKIPSDVWGLTTREIRDRFRKSKYDDFTEVEERLRLSFWKEYDSCIKERRKIQLGNITAGVCLLTFFTKHVLTNSDRLAYILTPPQDYLKAMEELLHMGLEQMKEIMLLPLYDDKGKADAKLAHVKLQLFNSIQDRVRGAVVQKTESKTMNLNLEGQAPPMTEVAKLDSLEEINRRLAELEGMSSPTSSEAIDVTPKK